MLIDMQYEQTHIMSVRLFVKGDVARLDDEERFKDPVTLHTLSNFGNFGISLVWSCFLLRAAIDSKG